MTSFSDEPLVCVNQHLQNDYFVVERSVCEHLLSVQKTSHIVLPVLANVENHKRADGAALQISETFGSNMGKSINLVRFVFGGKLQLFSSNFVLKDEQIHQLV